MKQLNSLIHHFHLSKKPVWVATPLFVLALFMVAVPPVADASTWNWSGFTSYSPEQSNLSSQELVAIKTDLYPADVYHLGALVGPSQSLEGIFYDNEIGVRQVMTVSSLTKGKVLVKKSGHDVMVIYLKWSPAKSAYSLTFDYLYNGIFDSRRSLNGWMIFNNNLNRFELYSTPLRGTSNAPIQSAYLKANKYFGKTVGIEFIEFR
jgi:hypothetical protein